jgi:hypothetical protein
LCLGNHYVNGWVLFSRTMLAFHLIVSSKLIFIHKLCINPSVFYAWCKCIIKISQTVHHCNVHSSVRNYAPLQAASHLFKYLPTRKAYYVTDKWHCWSAISQIVISSTEFAETRIYSKLSTSLLNPSSLEKLYHTWLQRWNHF